MSLRWPFDGRRFAASDNGSDTRDLRHWLSTSNIFDVSKHGKCCAQCVHCTSNWLPLLAWKLFKLSYIFLSVLLGNRYQRIDFKIVEGFQSRVVFLSFFVKFVVSLTEFECRYRGAFGVTAVLWTLDRCLVEGWNDLKEDRATDRLGQVDCSRPVGRDSALPAFINCKDSVGAVVINHNLQRLVVPVPPVIGRCAPWVWQTRNKRRKKIKMIRKGDRWADPLEYRSSWQFKRDPETSRYFYFLPR